MTFVRLRRSIVEHSNCVYNAQMMWSFTIFACTCHFEVHHPSYALLHWGSLQLTSVHNTHLHKRESRRLLLSYRSTLGIGGGPRHSLVKSFEHTQMYTFIYVETYVICYHTCTSPKKKTRVLLEQSRTTLELATIAGPVRTCADTVLPFSGPSLTACPMAQ